MKKKTLAILHYEINFHKCYQVSKKLKKNFNIIFISTSFFDSLTNLDINCNKLKKYKEVSYSFQEELFYFYKNINQKNLTYVKYIKYFEKKYLKEKKIKELINYDYFLSEKNNPREDVLFHPVKNKKLFLVYLILRKIEKIITTHKIDIFFSMFPANFINNCLFYIAKDNKKKFITTFKNRDNTTTLTDNYGFDFPNFIKNQNKDSFSKKNLNIFKRKLNQILLKPNNNLSSSRSLFLGLFNEIKRILNHVFNIKKFFDRERDYYKLRNKLKYETKYYYQKNQFNLFFVHLNYILRSLYLHLFIFAKTNKINLIFKKKYIYVPLHYFPEAYIYNQDNFDELKMINNILRNTPKNICLVVKPHPLFFKYGYEQHKLSYYKKLTQDDRVIITSPYTCNISLIKNAFTTVTYIGTSLLQSILLNKPAFRLGNSELNYFNGIYEYNKNYLNKKIFTKKIKNYFNYKLLYLLRINSINEKKLSTRKELNKFDKIFNLILGKKK